MVAAIIELCARQPRPRPRSASPSRPPAAHLGHPPREARRHPRPLRPAGHRLHRVDGPEPDARRGPGHLPARRGAGRRRRASPTCAATRCSGCRSSTSIFEEGTDLYWARSRVLEYLVRARGAPARRASTPTLGPDATGDRLDLPVRARGRHAASTASTSCARSRTSRCATRSAACRASRRWRASAGTRSSTR